MLRVLQSVVVLMLESSPLSMRCPSPSVDHQKKLLWLWNAMLKTFNVEQCNGVQVGLN